MHVTTSFAVKALTLVLAAGSAQAFWRMPCRSRSGLARLDPLVSPGTVSQHAHAIHGSSGFSETSGTDALMAGDCTSCQVSQDHSAYWTPALYFQYADTGDFELVEQVGGMLAYYLLYPNVGNTSLSAFPKGFQMIAGDTNQRNFSYPVPDLPKSDWTGNLTSQAFLRQAALGFNCLNYAIAPEGSLYRHFLPDKAYLDANCLDGVRFELMFPSCWNGVDVDSPNHKDHVAYPSEVMTGNCPPGFETRLVSLFYETIWNTYAFKGVDGQFVIANGDPTGYGYHGDFIMGWNETFLQDAVDQCTNLSGEIQDCALFDIQDESVYGNCNITLPSALVSENVVGPISSLPGNVHIMSGPGYAAGAEAGVSTPAGSSPTDSTPAATTAAANPVPTLSHSAGVTLASADTYVPGAVFAAVTRSSSPGYGEGAAASVTAAPSVSSVGTQSYFSTEYSTSGQVVNEVLWLEEMVTITASVTQTMTLPSRNKRHFHAHQQRGH